MSQSSQIQSTQFPRPWRQTDRPWKVIVYNDDHNQLENVVETFARTLPGADPEIGHRLAIVIHQAERGIVWMGARRQAEQLAEQLAEAGLQVGRLEQ